MEINLNPFTWDLENNSNDLIVNEVNKILSPIVIKLEKAYEDFNNVTLSVTNLSKNLTAIEKRINKEIESLQWEISDIKIQNSSVNWRITNIVNREVTKLRTEVIWELGKVNNEINKTNLSLSNNINSINNQLNLIAKSIEDLTVLLSESEEEDKGRDNNIWTLTLNIQTLIQESRQIKDHLKSLEQRVITLESKP